MRFQWNKYVFRQSLASMVFLIDSIQGGAVINFSATLLAQLDAKDSAIQILGNEATWIATTSSIGTITATLVSAFILQIFGRKWTYLIVATSNTIFWSLLALSTEVWHLYIGRAMLGFNTGLAYATCYIFIVEIIELKYRNILLNIGNLGINVGVLFVDAMGSYFKWQTTAFAVSGMAAVCVVILLYLENTHVPYLQKGDVEKATEQFFWYRQKTAENWAEFNSDKNIASVKVSFNELKEEWHRREFLLPLAILLWFVTTMHFTGSMGIMYYSIEIMRDVVPINEYLTVIITDFLAVIATFGTIISSSSLLIVSLSVHLKDSWSGWSTVTVIAIWITNFCVWLGLINMFTILFGTLFTGVGKSSGMALMALYMNCLDFVMGHLVPFLFNQFGNSGTFLFFGCCTMVGGLGIYFIMPESGGKSSEDIRLIFKEYMIKNVCKTNNLKD